MHTKKKNSNTAVIFSTITTLDQKKVYFASESSKFLMLKASVPKLKVSHKWVHTNLREIELQKKTLSQK